MDNLNKNTIISVSNHTTLFACNSEIYIIIIPNIALCETLKYGENRY